MSRDDATLKILRAVKMKRINHALELLVAQHGQRLGRLCQALTGDPAEAEELCQETLLRAYRALPSFEGRSSATTWLYTIARRTFSASLARRQRRRRLLDQTASQDEPATRDMVELVQQRRHQQQLREAMLGLPEAQRDVLLLRYAGGLDFNSVAQICGISATAARKRASDALKRLRHAMHHTGTEQAPLAGIACQES